jgi:hypothetical protein
LGLFLANFETSSGFRSSCYWTDWNRANTENIRIELVFAVLPQWKFLYCIDRFDHIKANKSKLINNNLLIQWIIYHSKLIIFFSNESHKHIRLDTKLLSYGTTNTYIAAHWSKSLLKNQIIFIENDFQTCFYFITNFLHIYILTSLQILKHIDRQRVLW